MQKKVLGICLVAALLEGFAGLGIEIYAIRISATYIGASIAITGIILAMVLIAIAIGYWYGGRLSADIDTPKQALFKAGHVLALSAVCHAIACVIQLPLLAMMTSSTDSTILAAIGVGVLFGVGLTFGSTAIPLLTQFLSLKYPNDQRAEAGKNAGMMVALTTIGSVLGSTLTPILLLPYIGLMSSLALFITTLAISAWLCTKLGVQIHSSEYASPAAPRLNYLLALSAMAMTAGFIVINKVDTGYQTATGAWFIKQIVTDNQLAVTITDKPGQSTSSCWIYLSKQNCHWYGKITVEAIDEIAPATLVFLGGAGMGTPSEVAHHNPQMALTVIDIDSDLPKIIERYFLKAKIAPNIEFIGDDARGYLNRHQHARYDFMLIDAFQGRHVASNLYTLEALTQFKDDSRYIMANVIGMPHPAHGYTQTLLKNWHKVFGTAAYVRTQQSTRGNAPRVYSSVQNILLCNFACPGSQRLGDATFFNAQQAVHTDDVPRLDRYLYRSLERL